MPTYKTKSDKKIEVKKPIPRTSQKLLGMKNVRKTTKKAGGGSMKKKGYAMGGAMKKKGMAKGGKLKMVEKNGKKVPFFAADGKGKMAGGGMMKKKGYAMGGPMKKKGMAKGGAVKVKSGDTLSQIAKSKGVTLKSLMAANPGIKNANMIRVGQSIKMPTAAGTKSSNPYKGMTKPQMAALRGDTAAKKAKKIAKSNPNVQIRKRKGADLPEQAEKRARVATRLSNLGEVNRQRRAADAAPKKSASKPKPSRPGITAKKVKPGITASKAGGGAMKKKGMKKGGAMKSKGMKRGGAMKKSKGGTVRGAGAATKGKRFGRSA
jgi:LysM repeat protein